MITGRPTKLTPELLEKAKQYIDGGYLTDELVPTIAGLACYIDIRRSTAYEWAKDNQEFSDIFERIMAKQENGLLKGGLAGDYNPTIAKLMLTKHGYSDKQETALTGADGGPIDVRDVTRTIIDPKH
jgi:hypothetical protein